MVAMSENDSIPSLENLINDKAAWLYFCPWYMNYLTSEQNNPVDNLVEIYQSDYCITLDELPDLKTYPITGSSEVTPTKPQPTTEPRDTVIIGDVNDDGNVTAADAVLLSKFLLGKNKLTDDKLQKSRADVNMDGKLNVLDFIVLKRKLTGK